jgi:Flp pilus assembly protein TadB
MECLTDVGNGIACKGKCEAEVKRVNAMVEKSMSAENQGLLSAFFLVFGVICLIFGLLQLYPFILIMGAVFVIFGVLFKIKSASKKKL